MGEEDGTFECQVIVRILNIVSTMTIDLWKTIEDQEQQRETEAAIKLIPEPPAILADITEEHDIANTSQSLINRIDKGQKAGMTKIKQETKRDMRKLFRGSEKPWVDAHKMVSNQKKTPTASALASKKQRQKKSQPEMAVTSQARGPSTCS